MEYKIFNTRSNKNILNNIVIICLFVCCVFLIRCTYAIDKTITNSGLSNTNKQVKQNPNHPKLVVILNTIQNPQEAMRWTKRLIHENVNLEEADDKTGHTPLFYACMLRDSNIARLLVKNRANVNARSYDGNTPLMYAIEYNQYDIVRLLLNNNANPNSRNIKSETPLYMAAQCEDQRILRILLTHHVNLNIATSYGWTPLDNSILSDCYSNARLLLKHGAMLSKEGRIPVVRSLIESNNISLLSYLIKLGVSTRFGKPGITELRLAALVRKYSVFRLMISSGITYNARENEKSYSMLKLLLRSDSTNINISDSEGYTPLMYCAIYGNYSGVKLLLHYGADYSLRNMKGKNAKDLARKYRHLRTARLLERWEFKQQKIKQTKWRLSDKNILSQFSRPLKYGFYEMFFNYRINVHF